MTSDELKAEIDKLLEARLAREYPDKKRRAMARFYENIKAKAVAHRLITGRMPTTQELQEMLDTPDRSVDEK